ncbi:hypothetical protein MMC07_007321 [Pseudocyphellaria aurata]|nr:hypothetical protein [Pseudocyphellaria aurata]
MEAVPSLCASGTVGIAAIGFAFGLPQRTITTRPATTGRTSTVREVLDESQMGSINSPQPSPLPLSASTSTSRLRKRSSLGQPLSPSNRFSGGGYSSTSTQGGKIHDEPEGTDPASSALKRSSSLGPSALEFKASGTAKSSWLRRMSTLSSLKGGSHDSTPPPGTPSLSYSNGSTAGILPSTAGELAPRNKLVKRTSSHKVLSGTITPHSTLPRPATSHQRILQQRYSSGEEHNYQARVTQSTPLDVRQETHHAFDDSLQTWLPFFTSQASPLTKDGFTRKRNSNFGVNRNEPIGSRKPHANGPPPTLLLATSITSSPANDVPENSIGGPPPAHRRRPSTAIGVQTLISPLTPNPDMDPGNQPDSHSRRSFSLADMFPSPSPSTWKTPRSASLRRNKETSRVPHGRRVSSAPLATLSSHSPSSASAEVSKLNPLKTRAVGRNPGGASGGASSSVDEPENPPSPLPPLNRISTFDIDLPTTAPSYPASPTSRVPSSSPRISSAPSPLISSPPAAARNKSHRPSGAPSDRTSTLLGSDNENSRFLSSDEDEFDFRSDTVYDSTRTGATGSSHSGVRRPPIETIFDESPPAELPQHKLITLQDLLSNQSFVESNADTRRNAAADQGLPTPGRVVAPCKEDEYPTPIHAANTARLTDFPSSPPDISLEVGSDRSVVHHMDDFRDDEDWSLENAEEFNQPLPKYDLSSNHDRPDPITNAPRYSLGTPNAGATGLESSPKANIFEWSEQSLADKESLPGSSPRPKTVHGVKAKETRSSRLSGRRGSSALHLRSQSVPVPQDASGHRAHNSTSKLESWVLGNKGVSEDWDGDFDFEETHRPSKPTAPGNDAIRPSLSSGMLVPRAILERQASVRGQFGQVKELTLLVEELKRLRQQGSVQGILHGQSAELWKEAEGIINLATLDDEEQEFLPPRSPLATGSDFDGFDEESPSSRRKSGHPRDDRCDDSPSSQVSPRSSSDRPKLDIPSRPRKESVAKAKSVLETIHQQRSELDSFIDAKSAQKNFDTTSLRDLVTRAGVVTRALKEIVRRAENSPPAKPRPTTPQDPVFSQIFQPHSPSIKTPRVTQSPKSNTFRGGTITGNDNEINGHMKMMTVV